MKTSIQKWICGLLGSKARAEHHQSANGHAVRIESLRVLVCQDGDGLWFAQGIDLDYAAGGTSIEDAQQRFERGLLATVRAHIDHFGTIERLLQAPPVENWLPLASAAKGFVFSSTSVHELPVDAGFPFRRVEYFEGGRQAA